MPRRAALLLTGSIFVFLTFMRYSVPALGWIVFVPFLLYAAESTSLKSHLILLGTLVLAFTVAVSKMATSEITWAPVPLFALPIAISYFVALSLAGLAHRRLSARSSAYTFAAAAVALGWVQYTFTGGGSWGVLAHTQVENLPLVQLAALTGLGGITFLVALGSGLAAAALGGVRAVRTDIIGYGVVLVCVFLYGELRLGRTSPGQLVRVGGVSTPVTHKEFREAAAGIDTLRRFDDELFARTARAADLGAKVIVWDEIATLTTMKGEAGLSERGQALARDRGVMLVMAYGVVESMHPFHYINKYRIFLPDGGLADEYVKRHPVPVDPSTPGTAHARVATLGNTRFSGGICYDYTFPHVARDNAVDGADVALVPSSDWKGIDPQHGQMAIMNAVAAGLPLLRPVRAATSFASDAYGRVIGSMRWDASGDGVLVVDMPNKRVPTLYARTGEIAPLVALAFIVMVGLRSVAATHAPRIVLRPALGR